MPKAILELPKMPESCWGCPLQAISEKKIRYCTVTNYVTEHYVTKRSENCPLKLVEGKEVEADFKQIDKKWECNKCKRGCVSFNGKTFAVNGLVGSGEGFVWLNPGEYAPCGYLVEEKEVEHDA